jgi:hypothetical protein
MADLGTKAIEIKNRLDLQGFMTIPMSQSRARDLYLPGLPTGFGGLRRCAGYCLALRIPELGQGGDQWPIPFEPAHDHMPVAGTGRAYIHLTAEGEMPSGFPARSEAQGVGIDQALLMLKGFRTFGGGGRSRLGGQFIAVEGSTSGINSSGCWH